MSLDVEAWLAEWHGIVQRRDLDGMADALAEDMTMGAPPYWNNLESKAVCGRLLAVIVDTIKDFTYYREWINGREIALEFKGHVGDLGLQGMDLITLNDDGKIQNLDVMIRPANALMELMNVVGQKMQERLAQEG